MSNIDYCDTQDIKDAEYVDAWKNAPKGFLASASKLGISVEPEAHGGTGVMEYDEEKSRVNKPGHTPSFYIPDPATLDTHIDILVEKYGSEHEGLIRSVAADLKAPMQREIELNRSVLLGRIVMYLIKSESNNILARCHQLMHSIPRLAAAAGYDSMRKSASACGVTCEWIRRGRDKWCDVLGLPIPTDRRKSDEARESYRKNGLENHWRHQRFQQDKPKLSPKAIKPCPIPNRPIPIKTHPKKRLQLAA